MPVTAGEYEIRENDDGTFDVVNTTTGKVHSSHTTEDKAKHQKQLLYAVGHGWRPSHEHSAPVVLAQEHIVPAAVTVNGQSIAEGYGRVGTNAASRVSTPQARTR